jgi:hypothetical protein
VSLCIEVVSADFFISLYKMTTASWHLADPVLINGVNTAILATPVTHTDSECTIEKAPDPSKSGPQLLPLMYVEYALMEFAYEADTWALQYLVSNSERLFKRQLSTLEVKAMYIPIIDRMYPKDCCLRVSVDVRTVEMWDCHSETVMASSEWVGRIVTPTFELKSLWIADTGTRCGLTLDIIEMFCDSSEDC